MTKPAPRTYKPEFKLMAVAMVLDQDKTVAATARELGISAYTLHNWVQKARAERGIETPAPASPDDAAGRKVREQEKRIAELEREVAFLKKAAAYFAKDPQ
jgi:transposase